MRVLVYGLGRSGLAALELCRRQGHAVLFYERREAGPDVDSALAAGATRVRDAAEADAEVCIAAPGVPLDHPDLARLRAGGTETIGEVEWVFRTVRARIVGVTGTAGKGSTTSWISGVLTGAGLDAPAGGNLDPALSAVARPGATLVAELSSFQLERCPTLRPAVAVLLNLGRDHLDRHGSVERYHAAKRALIAHLGPDETLVWNADDPVARAWAASTPARSRAFSVRERADAWLDRRDADPVLMLGDAPLVAASALRVSGEHQLANALATALACRALGLDLDALRAGLREFPGLPSRYREVGRLGGIRFVDDSIATRELAVRAALSASPAPVAWIGGGVDKGADLAPLEALVRAKVALFVGVGESGGAFADAVAPWTDTLRLDEGDGEAALRLAVRAALERLRPLGQGTVLLAPLAASFDQFRDYAERGRAFRRAVADLIRAEEAAWTPS